MSNALKISPISEIIQDAKAGKMYILVDHEDRENEGDLCIPAEMADADAINFMATYGRGLICLTLEGDRLDELGLTMMSASNSSRHETAFTVSIEAREGVTTGISAADRAHTVAVAIDPKTGAQDIATPGHVFPLRAKKGGVLIRAGHTEAAVDISRLAGLNPSGVICEVMNDDGSMARLPDLLEFAQKHDMKVGSIADLIAYRRRHDNLVRETEKREVVSEIGGDWTLRIFTDETHGSEHIVLSKGMLNGDPILVRMHSVNPLEDMLSLSPGRSNQIQSAMKSIDQEGRGVVVLLRDVSMKIDTDSNSSQTLRQYGLGAQILNALGLEQLILLTNSPAPNIVGLDGYGLSINDTRPLPEA